jgi:hypothetical protein
MAQAGGRLCSFAPLGAGRFEARTNEAGSDLAPTQGETTAGLGSRRGLAANLRLWRPEPNECDMTNIERAVVDIVIASRRLDAILNDATTGRDDYKAASAEFERAVAKIKKAVALTAPPRHLAHPGPQKAGRFDSASDRGLRAACAAQTK